MIDPYVPQIIRQLGIEAAGTPYRYMSRKRRNILPTVILQLLYSWSSLLRFIKMNLYKIMNTFLEEGQRSEENSTTYSGYESGYLSNDRLQLDGENPRR